MTHKEFYGIFRVMAEYYSAKPSDALMEIYWQAFQKWDIEEFKRACNLIMQTKIYPSLPKIPEIAEMIHGKPGDQVALAYHTLIETMKRVGSWETVIFEDGAIGNAVEGMGGWEIVNNITVDDWRFRRKEFEQLYLAHFRLGNVEAKKVFGAFDRINGARGDEGQNQPVLVTRDRKFLREEPKRLTDKVVFLSRKKGENP